MNSIRDRAMEAVNNDLIYASGYGGGEQSPPLFLYVPFLQLRLTGWYE